MRPSPVWHPFTQHGLGEPIPLVESACGAILRTADGRRIIDGISSWWVTTHGHCHPRITAAIAEQAKKLDQIIFAGWTHEPAERVADQLLHLMPRELRHVFFSDSGSTSVEVALKMALGYWRSRLEDRHRIIVMEHGYHGDTVGAMSVGQRGVFNQAYAPFLFDTCSIPFPGDEPQAALNSLECYCRAPDTAAFIVEPLILGAGGMLIYSAEVLREMRNICAHYGILFIADEVMTGWGRTGTLLACDQAAIVPDILCLSKGLTGGSLPLAVTMATEAIFEAHYSQDRARQLFHSSSYTANPIACAAASANLDMWQDETVLEGIAGLTERQSSRLAKLAQLPHLTRPRQLGTIVAVDIAETMENGYLSDLAPRLLKHFRDADTLLRPLGNTIYVMPPYCIEDADLDRLFDVIAATCDLTSLTRI